MSYRAAAHTLSVTTKTKVLDCKALSSLDCKTVGFCFKISQEIGKAWRKRLKRAKRASLFSLVQDLLFDCSGVLEYVKIRTVLQSISSFAVYSKVLAF